MSDSILQVNQIKNKGGTATGITIDNSNADVSINRPLTASSGIANAGTISAGTFNGTIGLSASQPRGHLNYISQKTISGVREFDVVNGSDGFVIDTTYTHYLIKLSNMGNAGTSNVFQVFVGIADGTIRSSTGDYWSATSRCIYNGTSLQEVGGGNTDCICKTRFDLGGQNQGADAELLLINPASTSIYTTADFFWRNADNTYAGHSQSLGRFRGSTEAHDRVRFYSPSSGTQISATVTLFGIKYVG